MIGEKFARTFAKACVGSDLSNAEKVEVLTFLDLKLNRVRRARDMDRVERSRGTAWEQLAGIRNILSVPVGRTDYDEQQRTLGSCYARNRRGGDTARYPALLRSVGIG